eukprot:4656581-Prymnesium_polylepis.1
MVFHAASIGHALTVFRVAAEVLWMLAHVVHVLAVRTVPRPSAHLSQIVFHQPKGKPKYELWAHLDFIRITGPIGHTGDVLPAADRSHELGLLLVLQAQVFWIEGPHAAVAAVPVEQVITVPARA